jgi:hypothetical protein
MKTTTTTLALNGERDNINRLLSSVVSHLEDSMHQMRKTIRDSQINDISDAIDIIDERFEASLTYGSWKAYQ